MFLPGLLGINPLTSNSTRPKNGMIRINASHVGALKSWRRLIKIATVGRNATNPYVTDTTSINRPIVSYGVPIKSVPLIPSPLTIKLEIIMNGQYAFRGVRPEVFVMFFQAEMKCFISIKFLTVLF